jgi:hypothetical protein
MFYFVNGSIRIAQLLHAAAAADNVMMKMMVKMKMMMKKMMEMVKMMKVVKKMVKMMVNNSRKHGKKEPQLFFHCGSFDDLDLQSLNECRFVFWFTN